MGKFSRNLKAQKEKVQQAPSRQENNKSGFKFEKKESKIVILPATSDEVAAIYEAPEHTVWANGKPTMRCGCPPIDENNKIEELMFDLYKARKKVKDPEGKGAKTIKAINNLAMQCKVKIGYCANVVDVNDLETGVQTCKLPQTIAEFYYSQLTEIEDGDDTLFDPSAIKQIKVVHNGQKGLLKKYKSITFLPKEIDLTETLSEDELVEGCVDLKKEFAVPYDAKEFAKVLKFLKKAASKFLSGSEDDDEIDYENDDEETGDEGDDDLDTSVDDDDLDTETSSDDDDDLDTSVDDDDLDSDIGDEDLDTDLDDEEDDNSEKIEELKTEESTLLKKFKKATKKEVKVKLKKKILKIREELKELDA